MKTIIYHPAPGDPQRTTWRGYEFESGKPTDIPDADKETIERATNNAFFEVSGARDQGEFDKVHPIDIPPDIMARMPDEKLALATRIAGKTIADKVEAEAIIRAEIEHRKGPKKTANAK